MSRVIRALNVVMGCLFLLALAVQYNDPDPVRWMAIYGAAALACLLAFLRRLRRWMPLVVGLVALAWAATLAPGVVGRVSPGDLFREIPMGSTVIEEGREMVGLLIVAAWMLVLLMAAGRRRPTVGDDKPEAWPERAR
jgi:hypothetical protein